MGDLRGLLREAWQRRVSLRMVSLKLSNVYDGVFRSELPLETAAKNHEARERLAVVMDELRRNKGWSVVLRGHDLRLRDAPRDIVNERAQPWLRISVNVGTPRVHASPSRRPAFPCAFAATTPFSIPRFRPRPSSTAPGNTGSRPLP